MTIEMTCTNCGGRLHTKSEYAGKRAKCPSCRQVLQIPLPTGGSQSNTPVDTTNESEAAKPLLSVTCRCGKRFQAKAEHAGKQTRCPACGKPLALPTPMTAAESWSNVAALLDEELRGTPSALMAVRPASVEDPAYASARPGTGSSVQHDLKNEWRQIAKEISLLESRVSRLEREAPEEEDDSTSFDYSAATGAKALLGASVAQAFGLPGFVGAGVLTALTEPTKRLDPELEKDRAWLGSALSTAHKQLRAAKRRRCIVDMLIEPKGGLPVTVHYFGAFGLAGLCQIGMVCTFLVASLFLPRTVEFSGVCLWLFVIATTAAVGLWIYPLRPLAKAMESFPIFASSPSPLRQGNFYPFFCVLVFLTACVVSAVCVSDNVRGLAEPTTATVAPGGSPPSVPATDIAQTRSVNAVPERAEIVPDQPKASDWVEFVDAGERFRCRIPPGCLPQQKESGARSKVTFWIGPAEIGVVVRASSKPPIQADRVEEIAGEMSRLTIARQVGNMTIVSKCFTSLDTHPAAGIVANVTATNGRSVQIRGIKCVAAGHDYSISVIAPSDSFGEASRVFDKFLESYRVTVHNRQ